MGFMDKMKQAAQDLVTEAKKATAHAQDKIEEPQIKRTAPGADETPSQADPVPPPQT
jgi:hypothetical protein